MLFVPERRRKGRHSSAIRASDVRAADLQEEPTKTGRQQADFPVQSFRRIPTKTAASCRTTPRAKRPIRQSERSERSNPTR
jgi:hypothetical protein